MLPLHNFKAYVRSHELFDPSEKILLAVSGGRDSVLMAHLFMQAGYRFGIAHCNFGLRAEESVRDEHFVRMFAADLDVPFHLTHFDTKAYAEAHQVSIQMAARALRYDWFEKLRGENGYAAVALAQHQDDVVETLLLNLVRGTGIAGLHGILPKKGTLIRPLLFLSRSEIDTLVTANAIAYVEDSSNLKTDYARNRIRHEVIPQLRKINPNLSGTFQQNVKRFAEAEQVLIREVERTGRDLSYMKGSDLHLRIFGLKELVPRRLLTFELLKPYHFSEAVVEELLSALDGQSGACFYSSTHQALVDRTEVIISPLEADRPAIVMVHPGDTFVQSGLHALRITHTEIAFFERDASKAFVDADKLIYPLIIRYWQEGDRLHPLGMRGSKKLSDLFIDLKVPLTEKMRIPLVINGNGDVIWVGGLRQDDRYKVTGSTRRTTMLEFLPH